MNESDVLYALPSSSNTNSTVVVNLPNGTGAWTNQIVYTVPAAVTNLTIQGNTSINCTGTAGASSYACTSTDNSIIQDDYASNDSPLVMNMSGAGKHFRMTGLTIEGGSGSVKYNGILQLNGPSDYVRLDHIHFNETTYSASGITFMSRLFGEIEGVADHVICDNGGSTTVTNCIGLSNDIADTIGYGDSPWSAATRFGTSAFFFIESSIMNGGEIQDCDTGGRFVVRYNTLKNGSLYSASIHNHGTKSQGGRWRGCRAFEVYHNYIVGPSGYSYAAIGSAGGTSLVWGNTLATGYYRLANISATRNDGSEVETNTPNGWGYCGTSAINPNTGNANGTGSAWDGNSSASTGYPCLDGLGRGQNLQSLNGQDFPHALNSSTGTIAFPREYLEPIYYFDNTIPYGLTEVSIADISSSFDRDVYVEASSFNGTSGTGTGLLANRPSTCTAGPGGTYGASPTGSYGVAYSATDANSGQGELYVCTAANTWTGIYKPYSYPHP